MNGNTSQEKKKEKSEQTAKTLNIGNIPCLKSLNSVNNEYSATILEQFNGFFSFSFSTVHCYSPAFCLIYSMRV